MPSQVLSARTSSRLGALARFFARHERAALCVLIALAACTRLALALGSPTPFGYVYDFYPAAVAYVYDHHALPPPSACWICARVDWKRFGTGRARRG